MSPVPERAPAAPVLFIIAKTVKSLLVFFRPTLKKPMTAQLVILSELTDEK